MFDWLFGEKYSATVEINKLQEEKAVPELNISEPVISFVECVRNNPKRFKHESTSVYSIYTSTTTHIITDTKEKRSFECVEHTMSFDRSCFYNYPEYLTKDEIEYLYKEISTIFTARKDRLQELKEIRKQRANKIERQKLMDIYCNKESQM